MASIRAVTVSYTHLDVYKRQLCGELLCRDFMQQLLKPAEGTEEAADKASQQDSQQNEETCDIIGKAELGRPHHRLKRPDGAGPGRRRTGVAVQPRHADGLPRPLIQSALEKVRQMQVCLLYTSRCV